MSGEVIVDARPIRCVNVDSAAFVGGCRAAQVSVAKKVGLDVTEEGVLVFELAEGPARASFGGKDFKLDAWTEEASLAAVDAKRFCTCPITG